MADGWEPVSQSNIYSSFYLLELRQFFPCTSTYVRILIWMAEGGRVKVIFFPLAVVLSFNINI